MFFEGDADGPAPGGQGLAEHEGGARPLVVDALDPR